MVSFVGDPTCTSQSLRTAGETAHGVLKTPSGTVAGPREVGVGATKVESR